CLCSCVSVATFL
ncbi:glutamate synthase domain protein, partial [Vibrio parahaemolyticus V-223/04]